MVTSLIKHKGITLLEMLFVLLLASAMLSLGIQSYNQLKTEGQIEQVTSMVNTLFEASKNYYMANCIANRSYTTGSIINTNTGQLDPTNTPSYSVSSGIKTININTDLVTAGYLTSWPPAFIPPFITNGFVVQFNLYNSTHQANFCYQGNCSAQATKLTNNVYLWTIQVAIQVSDSTKAQYYKGRLKADCVSSKVGSIVQQCTGSQTQNNYLVFERLPSMAVLPSDVQAAASPYWPSMPGYVAFMRQYSNDEDYAVTNDDSTYNSNSGYENYLCGG